MNKKVELRQLYQDYGNAVLRVCLRYTHDTEVAQDLAQDVFIRVHKSMDQFEGLSSPFTWIYRIAINISLDYIRAQQRSRVRFEKVCHHLSNQSLDSDLDQLPPDFIEQILQETEGETKEVVMMHFLEGLTHREIAEVMGVSRVAITRRLARFVDRIKGKFGLSLLSGEPNEDDERLNEVSIT